MRRKTILAYDVQRLADYDDEEYEQIGRVRDVQRETPGALLVYVADWETEAWFPRRVVRIDDEEILWCPSNFFEQKKRERV